MGETNGRILKADDTHFNREESDTSDYSAKKIGPQASPNKYAQILRATSNNALPRQAELRA
jgi:hypothetical protein